MAGLSIKREPAILLSMKTDKTDLTIIGAGMSGLMAATMLADSNMRITLLDKGRSVGGRLATRRIGPGRADHGAQFFTVRDDRFRTFVDRWLAHGLVFPWSTGWSNGSVDDTPPDGYPRYAVTGGMNALAKEVAANLARSANVEIRIGTAVSAVANTANGWRVLATDGAVHVANALVMTAPVPQSLALLDAGKTRLHPDNRASLEAIEYAPCLCAMAWVDGDVALPDPGAIQRPDAAISWIADNQAKGISPGATIVTLHAGPALSRALYDEPDEAIRPIFQESLAPCLGPTAYLRQLELKRWRYALPTVLFPERFLRAVSLPPLFFAGDAFGGPRVEGAALSGLACGDAIKELIHER